MDTRYWGPSGWKLLHSITFSYDVSLKKEYKDFFNAVAYVLPCKFCRKSYSEYILKDPVENALDSKEHLSKWLWRIHNKVNEKLRSQGLCNYEDPPFHSVKKIYEEKLHQGCSKVHFEGWEFLFSIVEGHPYAKLSVSSKQFNDNTDGDESSTRTPLEENMYNKMKPSDRLVYYKLFWSTLPKVLPFKEWRDLWKKYDKKTYDSRSESLKNLYSVRCSLEKDLELQNKTKFSSLCKELRSYKSGCNKSVRSKTCRRKK
jgi:hypothetical protein